MSDHLRPIGAGFQPITATTTSEPTTPSGPWPRFSFAQPRVGVASGEGLLAPARRDAYPDAKPAGPPPCGGRFLAAFSCGVSPPPRVECRATHHAATCRGGSVPDSLRLPALPHGPRRRQEVRQGAGRGFEEARAVGGGRHRGRQAQQPALVEHGLLLLSRRRIPSPIPRTKVTFFSEGA